MVHGALLSILDGIGSISRDVLATTICAAHLRQCHAHPLTKRMCLWGRIMTLYSRNVQTYCSLAHDIKRNQCQGVLVEQQFQAAWKDATVQLRIEDL
jgi:hypothetical protein